MHVTKVTQFKIALDASEQFVVTQNFSDRKIWVVHLVAQFVEGELRRVDAHGYAILGTTGKPGKRTAKTHWLGELNNSRFVAPIKILNTVELAKQGRSL